MRSLTLSSSEGFTRDDGEEAEYITLAGAKHNFGASHLGFALGLLGPGLTQLSLLNCNDLLAADLGLWSLVLQLPALRLLAVEGVNSRLTGAQLDQLGGLPKVGCRAGEERRVWGLGAGAGGSMCVYLK